MTSIIKTSTQIDFVKLRHWYDVLRYSEIPSYKNDTMDYAKDYFESGSSGYGWALHVFDKPKDASEVIWKNPNTKDDPMIRSKGIIHYYDGGKSFIGNEHFTQLRNICHGYMEKILDDFPEAYRGVIWAMHKGFKFVEHIDYPNNETYRIHVVLETNSDAKFKIGGEVIHMPADGYLWMVKTGSEKHTAWNYGENDRVHIHWQMPICTWNQYLKKLS